jgi:hypothetical protein
MTFKIKKVYISGGISGTPEFTENQRLKFEEAELKLKEKGFVVVNPFNLNHEKAETWSDYMRTDIKALMDCTHIFMLRGWGNSRGARIEHNLAVNLGIEVLSPFINDYKLI